MTSCNLDQLLGCKRIIKLNIFINNVNIITFILYLYLLKHCLKTYYKLFLSIFTSALGCADLGPVDFGWSERHGDVYNVGCNLTKEVIHLKCIGNTWIGKNITCNPGRLIGLLPRKSASLIRRFFRSLKLIKNCNYLITISSSSSLFEL